MQRSTLALGALVLLAAALIILDRPDPAPAPASAPALAPGVAGALPADHPPLNPAAPAAAVAEGPFATVLESMASGGYTYARVRTEGDDATEVWVAGPPTALAEGDRVSLAGAMGMQNFRAASLDRTFETILFVNAFGTASAAGAGAAAGTAGAAAPAPAGTVGTVVEVSHAAGYSYILVDQDGVRTWLAGNQIDVSEGETVAWNGGAMMQNFNSPSLGRTFDRILFADGLRIQR